MLKKLKKMYPHQSLMLVFIVGLLAIAASLVTQYVFKVEPCEMCMWQRYLLIAITVVAFIGTLFRGKIKKWFLGTISALATVALVIAVWQSLAQRNIVELPTACAAPKNLEMMDDTTSTAQKAETLLVKLQDKTAQKHIDCSKPEQTLLFKKTGITLANLNAVLMLLIASFSFYKLFFKPRRRFRRYNNNRNRHHNNRNNNHNKNGNNNGRRHRGSGYRRSNHRNHKNHSNQNNNG